jgi:hypothetical protein
VTGLDPDAAGQRGYGFVHLNQLAIEHLIGARGVEVFSSRPRDARVSRRLGWSLSGQA